MRAQVLAELIAGAEVRTTARKYNLGAATVCRLRYEIKDELERVGTEARDVMDELLLDSVATHLEALNRFAEYVTQPDYLKTQDSAGLAKLYAELREHPLSILEAASAARGDEECDADTGSE